MSVSVADLLAQPHLQLELLAGRGGLTRSVTWAHSSDSAHPWDWLSGGELLLKNGETMPKVERRQIDFLQELANTRVSGLVIGDDPATPLLSRAALDCAEALNLPVLRVPFSMSFIVLTRAVADAQLSERMNRVSTVARVYGAIRGFVTNGDLSLLVAKLSEILDGALYAVDAHTGKCILPLQATGSFLVEEEVLPQFINQFTHHSPRYRIETRTGKLYHAASIPYEEPSYLILELSNHHDIDPALLQHVVTAVAVVLAHIALQLDHERRMGAHLLADLLEMRIDRTNAERRLSEQGLPPTNVRLIVIRGADVDGLRLLNVRLFRNALKNLIFTKGEVTYLLIENSGSRTDVFELLKNRLGGQVSLGISASIDDVMKIPQGAREALWALARVNKHQGGIAFFGSASPTPLLQDPADAEALISTCLGELILYDKTHHTDLLRSLEVFLEQKRSWSKAALALNVHRQTVIYRMTKVSELTGHDLSETSDIAELWIALSLLHTLTGT